ncbi:MAG TPA: DNA polymerase IV [Planctomycetes bacterium]|nr:DNA polymerase IV [Planctomycetota bacterium]
MRKVIHVDMDAFYASVEQRDRPELVGRAVVIGGDPASRGVVATASYEARRFGIHSAMPAAEAYRRCPDAVFLRPDMARYKAVSAEIQAIFRRHTDLVEPLSLDEAYLDVTRDKRGLGSATAVAEAVRAEVRAETGLTASAGVAANKFLAKVASDLDKPDGLVVIPPERAAEVLASLPVKRIPGVGPKTQELCRRYGIEVAADFLRHEESDLIEWFGSSALHYRALAQGIDERPVRPNRIRKQISVEDTFAEDVVGYAAAETKLGRLCEELARRLQKDGRSAQTLTLKAKYADFSQVTRSRTLPFPVTTEARIHALACELLRETEVATRAVRLLGVGLSKLESGQQLLLPFFAASPAGPAPAEGSGEEEADSGH